MKNIIIILVMMTLGLTTQAQEKSNKSAKVEFHVKGNCEMCKKRIEKAALGVSGVKSADWNIESSTLYLIINEQKTDIVTIQKAIAKVGHDNDGFKATDEDYNNLHTCCAYDRN